MATRMYFAAATIKFIDCNFATGSCTLMVGSRLVDICSWEWDALRRMAQKWNSGLEIVSKPFKSTVMKFNAKNACRVEGYADAAWIMEHLGIEGQIA